MQIKSQKPEWTFALLTALGLLLQMSLFGSPTNVVLTQQETLTVTGQVTDATTGDPLPGVSILLKGTTSGTITDIDGKYSIDVSMGDVLSFSYVGYLTEEIIISGATVVNMAMVEDVIGLDEVVVIGYGVQKKSDLTGSVASVSAEDLDKIPNFGINSALQGLAAGVQVSSNTGAPGADVTIHVHGLSTLTMKDGVIQGQPIWIVDGVPAGANSVNPNDIESVEILKDAASAAIYGANGGGGVVLITTKKGKSGKPVANLDYYHGIQETHKRFDVLTGPEFGEMYTEMEATRGLTEFTYPDYANMPTYDYQDMIFRTAMLDNLDFNVSGGNEKTTVYMGLGYINQEGILRATGYKRFNFRLNSTYKVNDWFTIGENLSYTQTKTPGFEQWQYQNEYETPIIGSITVHPYLPPYDSTGNWVPRSNGESDSPLPRIELLHKVFNRHEGNGLVYAILEPLKGLTFESRISSYLHVNDDYNFLPIYNYGSGTGQYRNVSEIYRRMEQSFGYNWQNILSYNTTIYDDFNMGAMAGYEVYQNEYMNMSGNRLNLVNEEPEMWYFNASLDDTTRAQLIDQQNGGNKSTGYAYFARLNVDYKGKYLVQGNFRRDGSSKFGPENRFGNFPGISAGWKFSEESFIQDNLSILSFGKLRYGWGVAGVNAIRDYAYYATAAYLTHNSYSFDNSPTLATGGGPNVLANEGIHWEEIVTQNYGIDLTFFNNKLSTSIERFERHNKGMLLYQTLPGYAGWTVRDVYQESSGVDPRPIVNLGNLANKGWDFTIGWNSKVSKFEYSVDVNYSYITTIAEDLGTDSIWDEGGARGLSGSICRTEQGGSIAEFRGFITDGMFGPEDSDSTRPDGTPFITNQAYYEDEEGVRQYAQRDAQPGDFRFRDTNGDGRITEDDKTSLGNPFPKHELGIMLNLKYGWFDLNMFWQGAFGHKIFNATKYYGYNPSGSFNWAGEYYDDHYRLNDIVAEDSEGNTIAVFPENRDAEYPRIDFNSRNANFARISDFYVENGSYMRLKSIQLGVSLPSKWLEKVLINDLRFYIGAKNLLTFTKYSGMDPEIPQYEPLVAGIDKAAYPQARAFIFGASIKF